MSEPTVRTWRWPFLVLAAIGLIGLGVLATYLVMSGFPEIPAADPTASASTPTAKPPVTAAPSTAEPLPDLRLTLTKDSIERAGIVVSRIAAFTAWNAKDGMLDQPGRVCQAVQMVQWQATSNVH